MEFLSNGGVLPDEVAALKQWGGPLAVLHGVHDEMINGNYIEALGLPHLWRDKIHFLDEIGHTVQMENPELFHRMLDDFIRETVLP